MSALIIHQFVGLYRAVGTVTKGWKPSWLVDREVEQTGEVRGVVSCHLKRL